MDNEKESDFLPAEHNSPKDDQKAELVGVHMPEGMAKEYKSFPALLTLHRLLLRYFSTSTEVRK